MAEFVEVMRNIQKMCETVTECDECPLSVKDNKLCACTTFIQKYPEETEELVMKWVKEHPIKTNGDKFKEVFGFEPYNNSCVCADTASCLQTSCTDCEKADFWIQEYKESEEKNNGSR